MKKFFVSFLGVLFALQSTVVFAQDGVISNPAWLTSGAARQVGGIERWLYRNGSQAWARALAWIKLSFK